MIGKKNILVPLCGKTIDMLYLAQYANISGGNWWKKRFTSFFMNNLQWSDPDDTTYVSDNIIYRRDFMELTPADIGVDWILDPFPW